MIICFYYLEYSNFSPVQDYLELKLGKNINYPNKEEAQNELANIVSKWRYAIEINGAPDGHIVKKLSHYDFIEIRIKKSKILIRFPFYRDCRNGRLVLLNGFEKRDGYKEGGKTDRYVIKKLNESQVYYNDYHQNNSHYIEVPNIFKNA
jgi:hypothetical protein